MKGVTSSKSGGGGATKKDKKEHQQTGTSDKSGGNVGQRQRDERQEQSQADHELFLQAFEKPTQIYRYLRTRNMISPIFLHRTLTYMRSRQSPRNNARLGGFKIDSMLERKMKETHENLELMKPFMTLTFLGLYEKKREKPLDKVHLELIMVKVTSGKKRRVDDQSMSQPAHSTSSTPTLQVPLGTCEVPVNPSEEHPPNKAPALSIPSEAFSLSAHHNYRAFSIYVKVSPTQQLPVGNSLSENDNGVTSSQASTGASHGQAGDTPTQPTPNGVDENQEPSTKRRKIVETKQKGDDFVRLISRELDIYDKNSRCIMTEGEYELLLSEQQQAVTNGDTSSSIKNGTWESSGGVQPFDAFIHAPTLKFRLSWSNEAAGSLVERPRPLMPRDNSQDIAAVRSGSKENRAASGQVESRGSQMNGGGKGGHSVNGGGGHQRVARSNGKSFGGGDQSNSQKRPGILYQFLYNNNSRQQTEARDDLHCPWCSLNCVELYALLKHLKLSHPRFLFTYLPIQGGARIDVSVSELFDSTYVGNPNDLISQPALAFSRGACPVQRTPITHVIVCKPKRPAPSLSEFLEIEENDPNCPYDGQRPFVTGHNRLYNYSTTNLPMPPCAILQPSTEDQVDPPWLMTKICRMIDEFSDVNEGEKEFMKMWNLHVQHYTFVGDCQMGLALKMFIEEKGEELLEKKLYWNFVLHLCNMFEFGVLSPGHVFTAISRLQQFIQESNLSGKLSHWNDNLKFALKLQADESSQDQAADQIDKQGESKVRNLSGSSAEQRRDFSGIFKSETTSQSEPLKKGGGNKDQSRHEQDTEKTAKSASAVIDLGVKSTPKQQNSSMDGNMANNHAADKGKTEPLKRPLVESRPAF